LSAARGALQALHHSPDHTLARAGLERLRSEGHVASFHTGAYHL
jgi:hypothetical protein